LTERSHHRAHRQGLTRGAAKFARAIAKPMSMQVSDLRGRPLHAFLQCANEEIDDRRCRVCCRG
jgi:hypothetical protein